MIVAGAENRWLLQPPDSREQRHLRLPEAGPLSSSARLLLHRLSLAFSSISFSMVACCESNFASMRATRSSNCNQRRPPVYALRPFLSGSPKLPRAGPEILQSQIRYERQILDREDVQRMVVPQDR